MNRKAQSLKQSLKQSAPPLSFAAFQFPAFLMDKGKIKKKSRLRIPLSRLFLCRWWGSNPHVLLAQGILSFRHCRSSGVIQCYLMILRSLLEFRFFTHLRLINHQIFDFSLRFPSAPIFQFGTSKRKLEGYLGGMQS